MTGASALASTKYLFTGNSLKKNGRRITLTTDGSGTPCVSDPGTDIVDTNCGPLLDCWGATRYTVSSGAITRHESQTGVSPATVDVYFGVGEGGNDASLSIRASDSLERSTLLFGAGFDATGDGLAELVLMSDVTSCDAFCGFYVFNGR